MNTLGKVQDFEGLVRPRAVGIVGASADMSRIGGLALRASTEFGFRGAVYPVNPKYNTLKDLRCYPTISDVPRPCDVAIIALPSALVARTVEECGAAGIRFAVVLSAGFREIGEPGLVLEAELLAAASRGGVRVLGPNCLGVMNLATRMHAAYGPGFEFPELRGGPLALVTQSGGFGFAMVTEAAAAGIGFNYGVSTGNEADIGALDLLEYFLEQDDVKIVATFLEGVHDGRRLLALGDRALELGKPILIWKVGNTVSGRRAAVSHTARLTAGQEIYRAAFKQGGFIQIRNANELRDAACAFLYGRAPRGRNVAVLTSSGGFGVILADRCEERGLRLPALTQNTVSELRKFLPEYAGLSNPIDVTAQLGSDVAGMNRTLSALLQDPEIHQVILHKGNVAGKAGPQWAASHGELASSSSKPVLVSLLNGSSEETKQILESHGQPWFTPPDSVVFAAATLCEFSEKRNRLAARQARSFAKRSIEWPGGASVLGEHRSKQVLSAYGIGTVAEVLLSERAVAALEAAPFGYPLAVKVESVDIPHKTEADAVRLGIRSLNELKEGADAVLAAARKRHPQARIEGVLVQEMASGVEVMLGVVNDVYFGPVVALGLGGIFAETLRDITHRCAPVDISTAHVMIAELKGNAILHGVRGRPAADIDALAAAVSQLSYLATDHADRIQEIDVNPLFVCEHGVLAADALVVLRTPLIK